MCNITGLRVQIRCKSLVQQSFSSFKQKLVNHQGSCDANIPNYMVFRGPSRSCSSSATKNVRHSDKISNTKRKGSSKRIDAMRTRMIELHRLTSARKVVSDNEAQIESMVDDSDCISSLDVTNAESNFQQQGESVDAEFIRSVGKPDRQQSEAYVAMPYGLVRFDSMNKPGVGREKQNANSLSKFELPITENKTSNQLDSSKHISSELVNEENDDVSLKGKQLNTTYHKQAREESFPIKLTSHGENLFDEQYFGALVNGEKRNQSVAAGVRSNNLSLMSDEQNFIKLDKESHEQLSQNQHLQIQNKNQYGIVEAVTDRDANFFDEEYFGYLLQKSNNTSPPKELHYNQDKRSSSVTDAESYKENIFEEQYFSFPSKNETSVASVMCEKRVSTNQAELSSPNSQPVNLIDISESYCQNFSDAQVHDVHHNLAETSNKVVSSSPSSTQISEKTSVASKDSYASLKSSSFRENFDEDTTVLEPVTRRELKARTKPYANTDNPETAYDYAMKLRLEKRHNHSTVVSETDCNVPRESKWKGSVDTKGFRILKGQVLDLQHRTQDEVVSILKDSILYEDDKLIAIDKPYGLASHGGPGIHHSIGKLLEPLARRIDKSGKLSSLHLVHRLDKETTGVMVLAKTLHAAEFLLAMFKKRQVIKHYWVLTKGIPNPTEGIIDIPMAEGTVGDKYRMQLQPVSKFDTTRDLQKVSIGSSFEAITKYRVLASHGSAALVECIPETGVKHQIRCHLAFGLNTPIIGDHKYSHFSKLAPQRLHPEILSLLGVRQAKARHIPMHLHAKAVVLPEWIDGRNLFLSSRLPKHFVQNMSWLKLKPPS